MEFMSYGLLTAAALLALGYAFASVAFLFYGFGNRNKPK